MTLRQFKEDKRYLSANYEKLKTKHKNEFIVIHNKKIVSCGKDLDHVLNKARNKIGDDLNHSVTEYMSSKKAEMVI